MTKQVARRFECVEDGAAKFWEVSLVGAEMTVTYGKLGTSGQSKTKRFASASEAETEAAKLVREKTKKGYVEQGQAAVVKGAAKGAPEGATKDELAVLCLGEAAHLRDALGELRVLAEGEEPELADQFRLDPAQGEAWTSVLAQIEWLFEEADGGALGRYRSAPHAVVHVDNEGQFHLSPTLIDHLAWMDHEGEFKADLAALTKKHGLPAPLTKAAREKAVKGIATPSMLLAEAAKKPSGATPKHKDASTKSKSGSTKDKTSVARDNAAKGPRPLCRMIQTSLASDGTLYTFSPEDFGGAYGEDLSAGATFRFDLTTSSFVRLPRPERGKHGDFPQAATFAIHPETCLLDDAWRASPTLVLPPEVNSSWVARPLPDGSTLLLANHAKTVFRYAGGHLQRIATLPDGRGLDEVQALGAERFLLAQGEVNYSKVMTTLILDAKAGTVTAGPDLPGPHGVFAGDGRSRPILLHGYLNHAEMPATISVMEGEKWVAHPAPKAFFDAKWGNIFQPVCALASGEILFHGWRTMELLTLDLSTMQVMAAGVVRTNRSGAKAVPLRDGRVLFVGGTLYNNLDAEPELWDPTTRETTCLPGYEKEYAKQISGLAKYRAKKGE